MQPAAARKRGSANRARAKAVVSTVREALTCSGDGRMLGRLDGESTRAGGEGRALPVLAVAVLTDELARGASAAVRNLPAASSASEQGDTVVRFAILTRAKEQANSHDLDREGVTGRSRNSSEQCASRLLRDSIVTRFKAVPGIERKHRRPHDAEVSLFESKLYELRL